jgi:hypothetical protein
MTKNTVDTSLFFLHIPKTAGTSLRRYLEDQNHPKSVLSARSWADVDLAILKDIKNKNLVMGHFDTRMLPFIPSWFKKAVFLRDPVQRTISAISHTLRDKNFRPTGFDFDEKSIHELIRIPEAMAWFCNNQVGLMSANYDSSRLLASMNDRRDLCGEEGLKDDTTLSLDLELAKSNLEQFDFIGLTNRFDEYVGDLAAMCNFYPPLRSPRLNTSPNDSIIEICKNDIILIESYNDLDIQFYDFAQKQATLSKRKRQISRFFTGKKAITSGSEIDLSAPFAGYGFHELEYMDDGSSYRWSGPEEISELTMKIGEGDWDLVVTYYIDSENYSKMVDIMIDYPSKTLDARKSNGLYSKKFVLNISPSNSATISIGFRTDRVVSPSEYGLKDLRRIGFMLTSVSLSRSVA